MKAVIWPPYIPFPGRVKLHRNFKEWFMQAHPQIGTRKDCIARSSALHINSTRHENGLSEAVTCDLYSFHPQRREECVCFPVYNDQVTKLSTVIHDVYQVLTTTSVFYPPDQVVESCLLAAATRGPPSLCNSAASKCPKSVKVISREPRILGNFPYCPTPGPQARHHIAARTLAPRKASSTTAQDWGALPTTPPVKCKSKKTKWEKSKCINDKCMWNFIQPLLINVSSRVTAYGGPVPIYLTWANETSTTSFVHWGIYTYHYGTTSGQTESTTMTTVEPRLWLSSTSMSLDPTVTPVCTDEADCRLYCEVQGFRAVKSELTLLYGLISLVGVAGLGMLWVIHGQRIRRHWYEARARRRRRTQEDAQDMELIQIDPEGAPILEIVQTPTMIAKRGRGKVRFQGDGAADRSDDSRNGFRRVSGREILSSAAPTSASKPGLL